jgi:hypothetical protein
MKRTPLAAAVAAFIAASVAFASDLQTRDDCLEFHTPHHRVHPSLWKKSGKNASANSSVGEKLRATSISKLKLRHTMKKLPARVSIARCLKRKKGHEAGANRQGLKLSRVRERTKQEAIYKPQGLELSRERVRAKHEAIRKPQGLELSRERETRKSQERTNELALRAAEAEEMNRKAAAARGQAAEARVQAAQVQAAEARVQEEAQKRRLEKAYLDSLSPVERRARNTCRPVYAQYNRVETGMDLDQVQEIFDCNGKEVGKTEQFGSVATFHSFGDLTRGGLAIVFFVNGKVTTKSQIGLQVETGVT